MAGLRMIGSNEPNRRITYDSVMNKALLGVDTALEKLLEIASDNSCEPRDRIAASGKLADIYVKLSGLVEIESLPVLQAINGSNGSSK